VGEEVHKALDWELLEARDQVGLLKPAKQVLKENLT
jgi:hypothetical protein